MSPRQISELQQVKLRKLVHHAYGHVAYYREVFDQHGLRPDDIATMEDLQKLPFLTKDHVRRHLFFDLLSDNHDKRASSGSPPAGPPASPSSVTSIATSSRCAGGDASQHGVDRLAVRRPAGPPVASDDRDEPGSDLAGAPRRRIQRRKFIPAFELSESNLRSSASCSRRYQPVLIDGYAESLNFLAEYLKRHELGGVKPKGVISSAQVLPPQSREVIERQFGCGVHDKYGAREFSGIAYECEAHTGHHVVAENYIVEIIKDGRPAGQVRSGRWSITDLNNYCMPFIRYRIGDSPRQPTPPKPARAAGACPCRRNRRAPAVDHPGHERSLPAGAFFPHFFKDHDHIVRQYQVVQEKEGAMRLKVVKGARFQQDAFDVDPRRAPRLRRRPVDIQLEFRDSIPMVRTGKQQGSISRLGLSVADPEARARRWAPKPLIRGR